MDLYQRIGVMHCLLKSVSCPIGVLRFQDELGCSAETVYHDVAFMRNVLMAPIEGDGETGFFYLLSEGNQFELPGYGSIRRSCTRCWRCNNSWHLHLRMVLYLPCCYRCNSTLKIC